jgi:hypothetical protein
VAKILQSIRAEAPAFEEYASRAMGEAFASAYAKLPDSNLSKLVGGVIAEQIIESCEAERT